jgi:hypothetical protein
MQNRPLDTASPAARPWYVQPWPWLLMIGPIIVMLAGFHTAWVAFTQQDALVVDDYYKQGKAINQDLRRDRTATQRGMAATLGYDAAAGTLSGTLHRMGQPNVEPVVLRLVHSTLPAKDQSFRLRPDQAGGFSVALPMLDMARWQVLIESGDGTWRLHGEWVWPQQKSLALSAE